MDPTSHTLLQTLWKEKKNTTKLKQFYSHRRRCDTKLRVGRDREVGFKMTNGSSIYATLLRETVATLIGRQGDLT